METDMHYLGKHGSSTLGWIVVDKDTRTQRGHLLQMISSYCVILKVVVFRFLLSNYVTSTLNSDNTNIRFNVILYDFGLS